MGEGDSPLCVDDDEKTNYLEYMASKKYYLIRLRENITFLISERKLFELYDIFIVAFIKYKRY